MESIGKLVSFAVWLFLAWRLVYLCWLVLFCWPVLV